MVGSMKLAKIRLYVEHPLREGQTVPLNRDQAHYLFGVMRQGAGAQVLLFNGQDGEWRAEVTEAGKRGGMLACREKTAALKLPPDLWLFFAPIKKARTDFIVEKATEMGAARIIPVQTEFTNAERIRQDRLQAHAVEAAEQCGGTFVPEVKELERLDRVLANWPAGRQLMFCDEGLAGDSSVPSRQIASGNRETGRRLPDSLAGQPWAILVGPEGGFSEAERSRLSALDFAHPVALGSRILRADTAVVAAMTLWQVQLGDWG